MKAPHKARRRARWPWVCLAGAVGAIVGVYVFALCAFHHPQSWAGQTLHRIYRTLNPWDGRRAMILAAGHVDVAAAVQVAPENPEAKPDGHALVPAPDVVHVDEPLVIEPIVVESVVLEVVEAEVRRSGFEESELPRMPARNVTVAATRYMPYADEPACDWSPCSPFPFFSHVMDSFTRWAVTHTTSKAPCECEALSVGSMVCAIAAHQNAQCRFGCVAGVAAAMAQPSHEGAEEAGEARRPRFAVDPHVYPPHCPRSGYCPSHFHRLEIPTTKPAMPMADVPMSPEGDE